MTDAGTKIARELHTAVIRLEAATIILAVVLAVVIATGWVVASNDRQALHREETRTNGALCALRADLERRIRASEAFLATHPNDTMALTIRTSLSSQRRTVKALSTLDCTEGR
jgi:hypothetical protein